MTNSIVVAVLLGIFIALPSAAEDFRFGAVESVLSGFVSPGRMPPGKI